MVLTVVIVWFSKFVNKLFNNLKINKNLWWK
jgi:hypothetical protein